MSGAHYVSIKIQYQVFLTSAFRLRVAGAISCRLLQYNGISPYVNPNAHRKLICRVEHRTERLVQLLNDVEQIAPGDLMTVAIVKLHILKKLNSLGRGWLTPSTCRHPARFNVPVARSKSGVPGSSTTFLTSLRVQPVIVVVKIPLRRALEAERSAVVINLVSLPRVMVNDDPLTIFARKISFNWVARISVVIVAQMQHTLWVVTENVVGQI